MPDAGDAASVARDIGRIEARQDSADDRLNRIEGKLDQIIEYIAKNKGGIRMLFAVGSVAATISGIIAEAIHWLNR